MSTELASLNELFCKNEVAVKEVQKEVNKKEKKEDRLMHLKRKVYHMKDDYRDESAFICWHISICKPLSVLVYFPLYVGFLNVVVAFLKIGFTPYKYTKIEL